MLGREPVITVAVVNASLLDPVPNRLSRGLELFSQIHRAMAGTDKLDYPASVLRRIGWVCRLHRESFFLK